MDQLDHIHWWPSDGRGQAIGIKKHPEYALICREWGLANLAGERVQTHYILGLEKYDSYPWLRDFEKGEMAVPLPSLDFITKAGAGCRVIIAPNGRLFFSGDMKVTPSIKSGILHHQINI